MVIIERRLFGDGNGDPGLCKQVRTIYDWVTKQMGNEERDETDLAITTLKTSKRANLIQIGLLILTALSIVTAALSIYIAHKESIRSQASQPAISRQAQPQDAGGTETPNH